jgi:hypothetical protein
MSNIAGKAYAMNVITPLGRWWVFINLAIFKLAKTWILARKLDGLKTLSLIHYARWVVIRQKQFPRLAESQPKETLKYPYMLFFSNFNGSWTQYVDSFHMAIPEGLDLMWTKNIRYPKSIPLQPFHRYILHNQIWTEHYYNPYPLASANDVKAAIALKAAFIDFIKSTEQVSDEEFSRLYKAMLFNIQAHLGKMAPSPVISLANQATQERRRLNQLYGRLDNKPPRE